MSDEPEQQYSRRSFMALSGFVALGLLDGFDFDPLGVKITVTHDDETLTTGLDELIIGNGLVAEEDDDEVTIELAGTGGTSSGSGPRLDLNAGDTSIGSGSAYVLGRIPASSHPSSTLAIESIGATDDANNTPAGLKLRVRSGSTTLYDQGAPAFGSPVASIDVGGVDIRIELYNGTGSSITASGFFGGSYA